MALFDRRNTLDDLMFRGDNVPVEDIESAHDAFHTTSNTLSGQGALFEAQLEAEAYKQPIDKEQLHEAMNTLLKYKAGKAHYDKRIIDNEQWWKLRHWDSIPQEPTTEIKSKSGWLVNVILSKHADAMDAIPEPNCLPRAADDQAEAKKLSAIVPVIMEQTDFQKVWSDNWWKKLKAGAAIYGVYWDKNKLNGLGDISVKKVDPLNLYWEPGISDLRQSRNIFHVELVDNDLLIEQYPQLEDQLKGKTFEPQKYRYDDSVDNSDKSSVIDWYYHKIVNGKNTLQYCKFVNDTVLFATENDAEMSVRGLYDHGQYPFVADVMFPEEGTPLGFGYIDLCKDPQRQIDLMNTAITANCISAATPRWLVRGDGGINEEEFLDWTKPFVHVQGSIDEQAMKPIQAAFVNSNYISILQQKIDEMKETSGNRDVNNGGAPSGVTAASAIAAMQEQSGKLSRDQIQNSYNCYKQIVYIVIELIRQFYTAPREFRITGEASQTQFVTYNNSGIQGVPQGNAFGQDFGMRMPVFDIEVNAQKMSAYNKLSYNEFAIQMYQLGFFNPQNAHQALPCVQMMEFKGKDKLINELQQNGMLFDEFMQFQMMAAQHGMMPPSAAPGAAMPPQGKVDLQEDPASPNNSTVEKARAAAQGATQPR